MDELRNVNVVIHLCDIIPAQLPVILTFILRSKFRFLLFALHTTWPLDRCMAKKSSRSMLHAQTFDMILLITIFFLVLDMCW